MVQHSNFLNPWERLILPQIFWKVSCIPDFINQSIEVMDSSECYTLETCLFMFSPSKTQFYFNFITPLYFNIFFNYLFRLNLDVRVTQRQARPAKCKPALTAELMLKTWGMDRVTMGVWVSFYKPTLHTVGMQLLLLLLCNSKLRTSL